MKPAQCFSPADMAARRAPQPPPPVARPIPPASRADRPAPTPPRTEAAPRAAAEAIAPGKLRKHEQFRKTFRWALAVSGMHPHARLLGHDLLWRANHLDGRISPNQQPDTDRLAEATGLTPLQVSVSLEVLYTRGWLTYRPIEDGPRKGSKAMELAIPAYLLERLREAKRQGVTA